MVVVEETSCVVVVVVVHVVEVVYVDVVSGVCRCVSLTEVLRVWCVGSRFLQLLLARGLVSYEVLLWFEYLAAVVPATGC